MTPEWYYQKNNQEFGPITFDQLKELAATGQLLASDLVWRQGSDRRSRAGIIKGIFTSAAPSVPTSSPIPTAPPSTSLPHDPAASIYPKTLTNALAGFPASTGPREEFPLSHHHLTQLKNTESH